jgi:hypothetical protein
LRLDSLFMAFRLCVRIVRHFCKRPAQAGAIVGERCETNVVVPQISPPRTSIRSRSPSRGFIAKTNFTVGERGSLLAVAMPLRMWPTFRACRDHHVDELRGAKRHVKQQVRLPTKMDAVKPPCFRTTASIKTNSLCSLLKLDYALLHVALHSRLGFVVNLSDVRVDHETRRMSSRKTRPWLKWNRQEVVQ